MNEKDINSILSQILGTKEFTNRFSKEINKGQDWLLNYELGEAEVPGGGTGTVYTETWDNKLIPSIMEGLTGSLQHYPNAYDEAKKRNYGIQFQDDESASGFAELLHLLHQISVETQSSYEIDDQYGIK